MSNSAGKQFTSSACLPAHPIFNECHYGLTTVSLVLIECKLSGAPWTSPRPLTYLCDTITIHDHQVLHGDRHIQTLPSRLVDTCIRRALSATGTVSVLTPNNHCSRLTSKLRPGFLLPSQSGPACTYGLFGLSVPNMHAISTGLPLFMCGI